MFHAVCFITSFTGGGFLTFYYILEYNGKLWPDLKNL